LPPPGSSADDKILLESKILDFLEMLEAGIGCFGEAGEILVSMYDADKSVFAKITKEAPWVTVDMLWTLYRIGNKQMHPEVLLYSGSRVYGRLLGMSYAEQEKAIKSPVEMEKLQEKPAVKVKTNRQIAGEHFLKTSGPSKMDGDYLLTEKQRRTEYNDGIKPSLGRQIEKEVAEFSKKEHGVYMIVIKPGKNPQFFKRTGTPLYTQKIQLMQDPDDPTALIANVELYEVVKA
jgi:hypothetical protein